MKPICADCEEELKVNRNGVKVVRMVKSQPSSMRFADRLKCNNCGLTVLGNFGRKIDLRNPKVSELMKLVRSQIREGKFEDDDGSYEDKKCLYLIGDR